MDSAIRADRLLRKYYRWIDRQLLKSVDIHVNPWDCLEEFCKQEKIRLSKTDLAVISGNLDLFDMRQKNLCYLDHVAGGS